MVWHPEVRRGATFRVPVRVTDAAGVPVTLTDTEFLITPDPVTPVVLPFSLTPANGKLALITTFAWKDAWTSAIAYVLNDVVTYETVVETYWIALQGSTNKVPGAAGSEAYWAPFYQFLFLIDDVETASYDWFGGEYKWSRTYTNGDVKFISGLIEVSG